MSKPTKVIRVKPSKHTDLEERQYFDEFRKKCGVYKSDTDPSGSDKYQALKWRGYNSAVSFMNFQGDQNLEKTPDMDRFFKRSLNLFRELYGKGGVYEGRNIYEQYYLTHVTAQKFAVLAHLVIREPQDFACLENVVYGSMLHHYLTNPVFFKFMAKHIDRLGDMESSLKVSEVMSGVVTNMHQYLIGERAMAAIKERGGLSYLIENGIDLKFMLPRFMQIFEKMSKHDFNPPFESMFRLTLECIENLERNGEMTIDESKPYRGQLLRHTLEVSGRSLRKEPEIWTPLIRELAGAFDASLNPRNLLSYLYYIPSKERDPEIIKLLAEGNPDDFKKSLEDNYFKADRYSLIVNAKIKHLFTENELLVMCGEKFSNDLGI